MSGAGASIAFLAGALTTLSPCVLPILPLVLGASARKNRWAPAFIAAGLAASFAVVGYCLAAFGSLAGLEGDRLRTVGAALLGLFGLVFLVPRLSALFARLVQPLSDRASSSLNGIEGDSWPQNLMIGALLGVLWSPCSGPTLGAAVGLATQAGSGLASFLTMLAFGTGAALPLALFAFGFGAALRRHQGKLLAGSARGKQVFGALMVLISLLVLTGADKQLEAFLTPRLPEWLADLVTKF